MDRVNQFSKEIEGTTSIDDALDLLRGAVMEMGFSSATYLYAPRPKLNDGSIKLPRVMQISPKSVSLNHLYKTRHFYRCDPIFQACMETSMPIIWSCLYQPRSGMLKWGKSGFVSEFRNMLIRMRTPHGIAVPIHLPHDGIALVGMVSDAPVDEFRRIAPASRDAAMLLAHHFHDHVTSLLKTHLGSKNEDRLTGRELECLTWAAKGKTSQETADILGLAEITVRFHLSNASRKLSTVNRVQTVAKAISKGLIGDLY